MKKLYNADFGQPLSPKPVINYDNYTTHIILARNDSSSQMDDIDYLSPSDVSLLSVDHNNRITKNHSNHNLTNEDLELTNSANSASKVENASSPASSIAQETNLFQNISQSKPYSFIQSLIKNQLNNNALKTSFSVSSFANYYNNATNTSNTNTNTNSNANTTNNLSSSPFGTINMHNNSSRSKDPRKMLNHNGFATTANHLSIDSERYLY